MDAYRQEIKPSDVLTEETFENAIIADMALGGSTNTVLHLPAIANELGMKIPQSGVQIPPGPLLSFSQQDTGEVTAWKSS